RGAYQRRHDCALHHAASTPRGTGMNRRARPLALFLTYLAAFVLVVVTLAPLVWLFIMSISLAVALGASLIALVAGIPAAYSFSRFPGRMGLLYTVLGTYMMPPVALI